MKKKFFATVVALLAFGGVAVNAQTPETTTTETTSAACPQKSASCDCKARRASGAKVRKDGRHRSPLFKGIELTADQQKAFENMKKDQRAERQKARKERQTRMNENIKGILTPEQYAQYEKNMAEVKARKEASDLKKGEDRKARHDRRRDHRGKKPGDFKAQTVPVAVKPVS